MTINQIIKYIEKNVDRRENGYQQHKRLTLDIEKESNEWPTNEAMLEESLDNGDFFGDTTNFQSNYDKSNTYWCCGYWRSGTEIVRHVRGKHV